MKSRKLLASFGALLASSGMTLAQQPAPSPMATAPAAAPQATVVPSNGTIMMTDAPMFFDDGAAAPAPRFWAGAEYLLWWFKDAPMQVPVVDASPTRPTPRGVPGAGTTAVLGGHDIDLGDRLGARFTVGLSLGEDMPVGIEANYLFLESRNDHQQVVASGAAGTPFLGPLVFNTSTGNLRFGPTAPGFVGGVSGPGRPGGYSLDLTSRLDGTEINAVWSVDTGGMRLTLLAGYRYLEYQEQLTLRREDNFFATPTNGTFIFINTGRSFENFDATNRFNGGQLAARAEYAMGGLSLVATAKLALGDMEEHFTINGQTVIPRTGTPTAILAGATYAQPTNIGNYSINKFTVIPEITFNAGYRLADFARVSVGYNLLYIDNVLRPGDQIDPVVNPAFVSGNPNGLPLTGPARPTFPGHESTFWAQGINFGLEFTY